MGQFAWEYYDNVPNASSATAVTVVVSGVTTDTNFTLDVGGSISGVVYEADSSTPVALADVWVEVDGWPGLGYAQTASDGTYRVGGLPAGNYRVRAEHDGFATEYYNATDFASATLVEVMLGADTPNISFALDVSGQPQAASAAYRNVCRCGA